MFLARRSSWMEWIHCTFSQWPEISFCRCLTDAFYVQMFMKQKAKGNVSFETEVINWVFPILTWKTHLIQLIRQQKIKIKKTSVRFEYPAYWSSSSHRNYYSKMLTVSGRHKKAFNSLQTCLTSSSSIKLIHLIKRILYKIEKTRLKINDKGTVACFCPQNKPQAY